MTSLNKNYTTMQGSDDPSTIDDTNQTQISEIEVDMTTIETDLTAVETNKADKSNVLELDNTDAFTPDADYEPATKKYVDEAIPAIGTDDVTNDSTVAGATASDALEKNASDLATHEAKTETHGTTGDIVGEENTQTLIKKTLDDYTNHVHADAIHYRAKATEDILKGQPVVVTGYNVGESAQEVALADQATDVATAISSEDITNGSFGMMIQNGVLTDIDTSAFSDGDILYVDGTGAFTTTEPTTGFMQPIAYVLRSNANNGAIQVNAGYPKQDAGDVRLADDNDYFNSTKVEGALGELGEVKQQTGYDRLNPTTMPDLAFDQGTRTVSVSVKGGESEFVFWTDGKKHTKTTTQTVVLPDTTAFYYIYFDNSGVLQYIEWTATPESAFYEYAITAGVRWNAVQGSGGLAEERHGIDMSSASHKQEHDTFGARYANGMDIEGLADGQPDYTQTTYGEFWDEDIKHAVATASTHGWFYRLGTDGAWTTRTPDNAVALKDDVGDTYFSWNEWTGTTWQLTQGTSSTDYWITFFVAQPAYSGAKITKLMGQGAYSSRSNARDAIATEINRMMIDGLPGPELSFLYAVIARRDGDLEDDGNGNEIYDLRSLKGGGSVSSAGSNYHSDLLDLLTSGHPAGIISYDNATSGLTATDAQDAIDEVDGNLDTHEADTTNPHSVTIDQVTPTTTKGDILVENGSNVIRVPVGANTEILSANSAEASGVEWVSAGTPSAHASSHEDGGADEIDITGLSGIPTDLDTHASTEKTTPVDADELSLFDSVSSFVLKKLSFLNLKTTIGSYLMPVGTIKEFNVSTNPNTLYSFGTWSLHGAGRATVCIDSGDTDFDLVDETGGHKEMQLHNHTASQPSHYHNMTAKNVQSGTGAEVVKQHDGSFNRNTSSTTPSITVNNDGTGDSGNLQPYIVIYRWVRTA